MGSTFYGGRVDAKLKEFSIPTSSEDIVNTRQTVKAKLNYKTPIKKELAYDLGKEMKEISVILSECEYETLPKNDSGILTSMCSMMNTMGIKIKQLQKIVLEESQSTLKL